MMVVYSFFALVLIWCGALAQAGMPVPEASLQCHQAVAMVERAAGVPPRLMAAIARVESGRADAQGGVHPWPWTINVEGAGYVYASKAEAIAAVRGFQARGARSIDVGCMQVNLMYHPTAFASLDEAFDPMANARYAAKFLRELFGQTRDWAKATAMYHSSTPALGEPYQRKVLAVLTEEERRGVAGNGVPPGHQRSDTLWPQTMWTAGAAAQGTGGIPRLTPAPPTGGHQLSNRAEAARVIPAPQGTAGRGLEAYRATPIPVASRMVTPSRL